MRSLDMMKKRLNYNGYDSHDKNLVTGKYKSFKDALRNSYQAEWITFNDNKWRCLINRDKLVEDYDQKEISIDFESGMKSGDTFYWDRTDSYWLVYLQRLEEEAYFRAQIRKCDYQINGYWVWLRGPAETALIWRQKHDIYFNEMNHSIMFYVQKNEETLEYFSRLKVIKFDGHNWRVAATDKYSQEGILEVYLEEYFDNEMEDAMVIPEIIKPDVTQPYIDGPQVVKAYDTNLSYSIVNSAQGEFVVNSTKVKFINKDSDKCLLEIITGKSTEFNLIYKVGDNEITSLPITVKSM